MLTDTHSQLFFTFTLNMNTIDNYLRISHWRVERACWARILLLGTIIYWFFRGGSFQTVTCIFYVFLHLSLEEVATSAVVTQKRAWQGEEKRAQKSESADCRRKKSEFTLFLPLPHHIGNPGEGGSRVYIHLTGGKSKGLE
jgi:hypothetical protein